MERPSYMRNSKPGVRGAGGQWRVFAYRGVSGTGLCDSLAPGSPAWLDRADARKRKSIAIVITMGESTYLADSSMILRFSSWRLH